MNHDIYIILLKYLGISALLLLIFATLLRGRVSYRLQRITLLATPIIAAVGSFIEIDLIKFKSSSFMGEIINQAEEMVVISAGGGGAVPIEDVAGLYTSESITSLSPIYIIWLAVALIILIRYVMSLRYIRNIRQLSTIERRDHYSICRSGLVETPFSFFHSIYLDRKVEGEKLEVILRHERAHIESRHYLDKIVMEIYMILSWFNPTLWFIRRELCSIHEFEADRVVLSGYEDVKKYKKFLFDEAGLSSPRIANGFNNSLIKQRFLEMKKNYQNQRSTLHKALSILAVGVVIALTSLTSVVGEEIKIVGAGVMTEHDAYSATIDWSKFPSDAQGAFIVTMKNGDILEFSDKEKEEFEAVNPDMISSINIFKKTKGYDELPTWVKNPELNYYVMNREQYILLDIDRERDLRWIKIYRRDGYTEVDIAYPAGANFWWCNFSTGDCLVDPKTGDRYMAHSLANGLPINRNLIIKGGAGKQYVITCIFPPLKEGVKRVNYVGDGSPNFTMPKDAGSPTRIDNIKVEGNIERPYKDIESGEVITLDPDFKI